MVSRNIIQLMAYVDKSGVDQFYALCNDNTIWLWKEIDQKWHQAFTFNPVPGTGA